MKKLCTKNQIFSVFIQKLLFSIIPYFYFPSRAKPKNHRGGSTPPRSFLLLAEGHTVGALVHSGICLVGAYQNALQGAVICLVTVMGALLYGAFDALVCIAVHSRFLLFL